MLTIPHYTIQEQGGPVRHTTNLYSEALRVQTALTRKYRTLHVITTHNV